MITSLTKFTSKCLQALSSLWILRMLRSAVGLSEQETAASFSCLPWWKPSLSTTASLGQQPQLSAFWSLPTHQTLNYRYRCASYMHNTSYIKLHYMFWFWKGSIPKGPNAQQALMASLPKAARTRGASSILTAESNMDSHGIPKNPCIWDFGWITSVCPCYLYQLHPFATSHSAQ